MNKRCKTQAELVETLKNQQQKYGINGSRSLTYAGKEQKKGLLGGSKSAPYPEVDDRVGGGTGSKSLPHKEGRVTRKPG